ncbi:MAG: hypothetical protein LLF28_00120 [Nitrospiraceae bacterium]|nr:hypothetical protein [Nitrospiraceae bacterium]
MFGGSGYLPSHIILEKQGYIYSPGSSDCMELVKKLIDFVLSEEGKAIYRKYHYFMSPDEVFAYIGENRPVGGEYVVPQEWLKK